jgi:hypothetical protein
VFAPALAEQLGSGLGASVEQVFRGELSSVKSVPAFSRGAKAWDAGDRDGFAAMLAATDPNPQRSGAAALTSADLTETIFALRSGSAKSASSDKADAPFTAGAVVDGRAPRRAPQMFWEDAGGADMDFSSEAGVDVTAARTVGGNNVLIPLPAAAWSALSVLAGAGLLSAARRRFGWRFC